MQFDAGLASAGQAAAEGADGGSHGAVEGVFMHLVKRAIHEACEEAFNEHVAGGPGHQAADGVVAAEGDEGAEIPVVEGL